MMVQKRPVVVTVQRNPLLLWYKEACYCDVKDGCCGGGTKRPVDLCDGAKRPAVLRIQRQRGLTL